MAEEKNNSASEKVNLAGEEMVDQLDDTKEYKEAGVEDYFSDIEMDNSAKALRFQKKREAKEETERTRFRLQLTLDEIREDFETITGGPVQMHKRKKKPMTKSQKLKYEMRFPGSQLEKLFKQQVLKEKPRKKKVARWSFK